MKNEIAVLTIERAWLEKPSSNRVNYVLIDPDETEYELVTPRGSTLGKLLLKEIREVELEEAQEAEDAVSEQEDLPYRDVRKATGLGNKITSHPYGSAGDDSQEVRFDVRNPVGDHGVVSGRFQSDGSVRLTSDVTYDGE
jgi:hypothetical protein